ncbi:MAG: radical SAM protein [archaeon]
MKNIREKVRVYRKNMTLKRIINYLLVKTSLKIKSPKVFGRPLSLFIEPTNICDLKCVLCPRGNDSIKKKQGTMNLNNFKKIIDEIGDYAISTTLWNYGEPFINKNMIEMIKYSKKKGLKVITSTNGFAFKNKKNIKDIVESKLDYLIVALDGTNQKTLEKYRVNADYKLIIEGLKELVKEKKRLNSKSPCIILQFLIMKHNEHQIETIKKIAKEIGVDELILKSVNIYENLIPKEEILLLAKRFLPDNKDYQRYQIKDNKIIHKKTKINGCDGLWIGTNIDYDGNVIPCCYDAYEWHIFGNVFKEPFMKIWNNQRYINFRKQVLKDKSKIKLCRNCPSNIESQDIAKITF